MLSDQGAAPLLHATALHQELVLCGMLTTFRLQGRPAPKDLQAARVCHPHQVCPQAQADTRRPTSVARAQAQAAFSRGLR